MKHILITHKNCMDGHGVALVVKYYDILHGIEDREIIYMHYGDKVPNVVDANVIIGDFSFDRDILEDMHRKAAKLVVIDHHATAKEALAGLDYCIFDMNKSGAVLVWEYLFPKNQVPILLNYIQDRDLWKWKLMNSKAISSYLPLVDFKSVVTKGNIERWLYINNLTSIIHKGDAILAYQESQVNKIAKTKKYLPRQTVGGVENIICINSTTLISEIGNDLSVGEPFVAMYFETEDKRVYSLRSNDGGMDVSLIAKKFKGGGHPRAAGFSIAKPKVEL